MNIIIGSGSTHLQNIQTDFIEMYHYSKFISAFTEDVLIIDQKEIQSLYFKESPSNKTQEWRKQLIVLESEMASGNEQKAVKIVSSLFEQLMNGPLSNLEMTEFILAMTEMILNFLRNKELYKNIQEMHNQEIEHAMQQVPILFHSKAMILLLIQKIANYQAESKVDGKAKIITKINQFIYDNINKDVSLTAIADYTHFNPSYLSRFYKEEVGKNLSDVINEVRLKKAKYYLTETAMPINEIATNLGFNSPSYFTLYFKKNTLQSPQEYREKVQEVKKV